jgi:hypothetical protein
MYGTYSTIVIVLLSIPGTRPGESGLHEDTLETVNPFTGGFLGDFIK